MTARATVPIDFLVGTLCERQLNAIRATVPAAFTGHEQRMAVAMADALRLLDNLMRAEAASGRAVADLVRATASDPEFAFLATLPQAPVLSMLRALALEEALYGVRTDATAELALLMGTFTVLLDGLLDEVPSLAESIRPWLDEVMGRQPWLAGTSLPAVPSVAHPIAGLTCHLAQVVIERAQTLPGWRDPQVRQMFGNAAFEAYSTELDSVNVSIATVPASDAARRIVAKSTTCIWAGALIPVVAHGWPPHIAPAQLEALARSVGTYGGWIDDTVDVRVDLDADRWSAVLLQLDSDADRLGARMPNRARLSAALQSRLLTDRLASAGVERLAQVRQGLAALTLDERLVLPALADMTACCLNLGPERH